MGSNILWKGIINFLNISWYIQISIISLFIKNICVFNNFRIPFDFQSICICLYNLLNILLTQTVFITVFFKATTGIY